MTTTRTYSLTRLLTAAVLTLLAAVAVRAQALTDTYNRQRPVVIVCDWDKPPYEFADDQGQPAGSNIDVMQTIMERLGLPCVFVMKEWGNAIKTFERGDADLIFANINRYKEEPYVATQIINYNRVRVAMTRDTTGIISLSTLEREGVVLKTGDYSAMYFQKSDSTYSANIEYQSPKVALTGLKAGDNKYFVWGEEPLKWKLKKLNLTGIYLNDVSIPVSEVHIIGRDKELIDHIDDQYSRMKQSGELEQMLNKWFHPERVAKPSSHIAAYIVLALLMLGAVIFFLNRLAKAHVRNAQRSSSELSEMMAKALHMGNYDVMEYDIRADRISNVYGTILPHGGLTLKEFSERIHPDQQQEFAEKTRQLLSGRSRRFELDKQWNAGTREEPHWLNFHGHAILEVDGDGQPAYIVNAVHDVTHEVEEDREARKLLHRFERLTNLPQVPMSFYSRDGWLIDINDAMKELCAFDSHADAERYWRSVNMFDIPIFRNALSDVERDGLLLCQHMYYPDLDIDKYIELSVMPLRDADGELAGYLYTALDMTEVHNSAAAAHRLLREEKTTQQHIALRRKWLAYLLRKGNRYIVRSDMADRRVSFFRSLEEPELTHSFAEFADMLEEADREPFMQTITDSVTTEPLQLTLHLTELSHLHAGSVFTATLVPVTDGQGNITGRQGVASDVTLLSNTRRRLDDVAALANDSARLKSGFMASMTHELRTPLNAIVGFTSVLESLGATVAERSEYVRVIRNSSDMLQRLIDDVIEASGTSHAHTPTAPDTVDFVAAFDDICLTLQQRVDTSAQQGVTFVKHSPYDSFYTAVDTGRVQQVLTNFVTNAVKFTSKGHISVGYRYQEKGLYIYCEDTGRGIPADKHDIIFQRFVKLDEFVQGTGMGLAICKSIVERLGGRIGVDSDGPGQGATFWFWIPCQRTSNLTQPPNPLNPSNPLNSLNPSNHLNSLNPSNPSNSSNPT